MKYRELFKELVTEYEKKTPNSRQQFEEAKQYMAAGETRSVAYYDPYPITMKYGSGCYIYDVDGNEYLDFINNFTSLLHGHAHPVITKAIQKAAEKGTAAPAGIKEQVTLAKMLCERIPGLDCVRFCNSGTEASMFAVRVAKAYTGKDGIVKIIGGYHGTTDIFEFSTSMTKENLEKSSKWEVIPDSKGISPSAGEHLYAIPYNDLEAAEEIFREKQGELAAIIVESFMGAGGVIPPAPGYLKGLRELTEKYGILMILDEVQSLRMSVGGSQEKYGIIPDISVFGKIIGGGLPVGAFGGKREVMSVFERSTEGRLTQSGTFNGNRVTMAAGIASLQLADKASVDRIEKLGIILENGMEEVIQELDIPVCVTREGSLLNVHMQKDKPYDYASCLNQDSELLNLYFLSMLNEGIFHATRGMWVISTVMTEKEINIAVRAFRNTMTRLKPYMK